MVTVSLGLACQSVALGMGLRNTTRLGLAKRTFATGAEPTRGADIG